jgi:hypothetical protein
MFNHCGGKAPNCDALDFDWGAVLDPCPQNADRGRLAYHIRNWAAGGLLVVDTEGRRHDVTPTGRLAVC